MSAICVRLITFPWMWLFMKNPFEGAQCAIRLATDPQLKKVTGEYFKWVAIAGTGRGCRISGTLCVPDTSLPLHSLLLPYSLTYTHTHKFLATCSDCEIAPTSEAGQDKELAKKLYMQTIKTLQRVTKLSVDKVACTTETQPGQLQLQAGTANWFMWSTRDPAADRGSSSSDAARRWQLQRLFAFGLTIAALGTPSFPRPPLPSPFRLPQFFTLRNMYVSVCVSLSMCVCLYVNLMCAQAKFAEFVFYFLFDFILLRVAAKKGNPWTRHKHRFTRSAQLENQHMFWAEIRIFHMLMMMGTFFCRILFYGLIQSIHKGQRSLCIWYIHA